MYFITCDLEGVFTPEIWIEVAKRTGIKELFRTTREEKDYDKLMKMRIDVLKKNNIHFSQIAKIIDSIPLLDGAEKFLSRLRSLAPTAIVSDTFAEFFNAGFAEKLNFPLIFCHNLIIENDFITGYKLRIDDSKFNTVQALHRLNYKVFAFGDSYNDIRMIEEADDGALFRAPDNIKAEYPNIKTFDNYDEFFNHIEKILKNERI